MLVRRWSGDGGRVWRLVAGGGAGGAGGAGIGSRGADGGAGGCGGAVTNLWLNGGPRAEVVSFLDDQGKSVPRLCGESGSSGVAAPECGTVTVSGGILLTVKGGAGGSAAEVDPVSLERTVVPFAYYEDAVGYRTAELKLFMNAGQSGGRGGCGGDGFDYGLGGSGGGGGSGGDSGSVSGDNHASGMPESLCGTNGLDVAMAVLKGPVSYLDYDADTGTFTNAVRECMLVTSATRVLDNGWYAVQGTVTIPTGANLSVVGTAHLILCDGATLTIPSPGKFYAAVNVSVVSSLVIYGQTDGTGALVAQGGGYGAGIGGGYEGAGGTVTINGGAVTAVGNNSGSDIGPSDEKFGGTVTISGGIFARPLKGEWIADGYAIGANADSATSAAYPHAVMPAAFTVTISDNPHSTVQWTYGDGTVVTPVTGTSFKLGTGMTGVCVIFTPEYGYCFAVEGETGVRPLPSPVIGDCAVAAPAVEEILCEVTFAVGDGIRHAAYVCGGVTNELVTGEIALVVQFGTRIELIVEELPRHYPFAGARTFTVEQETMRVEIFASPIPKGMEGNPFQVGADVFAATNAAGALTITGTGAMSNFVSAAGVPWMPATVKKVTVDASVTSIGANAWSGMEDSVVINGTALSVVRYLAPGVGSAQPVGAISGAEFDQMEIVGGKAYLDVSVYTSDTITNQNWSVATNGVIEVPAEGKQGFFYLMSKPSVPSNKPIVPPPLPIEQ